VNEFKGDGERGFKGLNKYFKFVSDSSPYTFHNKTIDRVIRTIRDAIGYRQINEAQLQSIIYYYNNTYHRDIDCTPQEMQDNPDFEEQYIRWCIELLNKRQKHQHALGLYDYKPGNILLLHIDESKTKRMFKKKRGYWSHIGVFIKYEGQSKIMVKLLNSDTKIIIPIFYSRFLAPNQRELDRYDTSRFSLIL
jgi:ribosomal protein L21E